MMEDSDVGTINNNTRVYKEGLFFLFFLDVCFLFSIQSACDALRMSEMRKASMFV